MTRLLVTLCNKSRCPDVAPGVVLVEVDTETREVKPRYARAGAAGATGLCMWNGHPTFIVQPNLLVTLDGSEKQVGRLDDCQDVHSICTSPNGRLFIASTGTNEVRVLDSWTRTVGPQTRLWAGPPRWEASPAMRPVHMHINSICWHRDRRRGGYRLVASMFGPKHEDGWAATREGMVAEVGAGGVWRNLRAAGSHPHSLVSTGRHVAWCVSGAGSVVLDPWDGFLGRTTWPLDRDHYYRGLAFDRDGTWFVGASTRRHYSRSAGTPTGVEETGEAGIRIIPPAGSHSFISLMDWGREVYDIMVVD